MIPRLLRMLAIAIAIAAAIDPAITSRRTTRPEVAIIAAPRDSLVAERVVRSLGNGFTVTRAAFPAADATILVGGELPQHASELAAPVFAIIPGGARASTSIEVVNLPTWAPADGSVAVTARVRTAGGKLVTGSLRADGVIVDADSARVVDGQDQLATLHFQFVPTHTGVVRLVISAATDHVDAAIEIRSHRWPVLFYDTRPSWMSTFVRRAVEGDNRMIATSRVVTSRNISTAAGRPPASLSDFNSLSSYDAIVIGAPDALTEQDVAGLEAYLRRRGGSVVLVLDQRTPGPWQRLAGASAWIDNGSGRVTAVERAPHDSSLRASELAWPARLPFGATVVAHSVTAGKDSLSSHPVIWRTPIGAGEVIVSGALDAWRYRDRSQSHFDSFWRGLIAEAASRAPESIQLSLSQNVAAPTERVQLRMTVRDAMQQPLPARLVASATMQPWSGGTVTPISLAADGSAGEFAAEFRAPDSAGTWRIVAESRGARAEAALVVSPNAAHAASDTPDLLAAWSVAHGGITIAEADLQQLPGAIRSAIRAVPRPVRWHPMRSIWWFVPFVLALSAEWWWRRRNGRA